MPGSWNTKWGPRRVRHDPPTLAEAIAAAQGLTDDRELQAEIAAGLIGAPLDEVRAEMKRLGADRVVQTTMVAASLDRNGFSKGPTRTVVVERKASRRLVAMPERAVSRTRTLAQRGR